MDQDPTEFKVVDHRDIPSSDPKRLGRHDRLVVIDLGDNNLHTVTLPLEDFNEATLTAAVRGIIGERAKWIGKTFKL